VEARLLALDLALPYELALISKEVGVIIIPLADDLLMLVLSPQRVALVWSVQNTGLLHLGMELLEVGLCVHKARWYF